MNKVNGFSDEEVTEILYLRGMGLSIFDIGYIYGKSDKPIYRVLNTIDAYTPFVGRNTIPWNKGLTKSGLPKINDENKYLCSFCGKYKEMSEFSKNSNKIYGIQAECKKCRVLQHKLDREVEYTKLIFLYSNGTMSCSSCDEQDIDKLSFEHNKGGGTKQCNTWNVKNFVDICRKMYKSYGYYPSKDDICILCHNCNWKSYLNHIEEMLREKYEYSGLYTDEL